MKPTDVYMKETGVDADLRKRAYAAKMTGDEQAADEVRALQYTLILEDVVKFAKGVGYRLAVGKIKTELEQNYLADELGPEALKFRVVTYEQGVLKVSTDATLAVKKDEHGNPEKKDGKYVTVHGYLDQATMDAAQNALFTETSVKHNEDLFAQIKAKCAAEVETAFKDGPLMFTPKKKADLTDLL